MKPIDSLKAAGAGLLLLALNLALTTVVIFAYSILIEPGKPPAYYNQIAPRIAEWSAPTGGALLLFGAGWLFARKRSPRAALIFIFAAWLAYGLIDSASGLMMGIEGLLQPVFFIHMLVSLLAGLAGARLGARQERPA